jgi:hypothetical protein
MSRRISARRSGLGLFVIVVLLEEDIEQRLQPRVDPHQQIDDASKGLLIEVNFGFVVHPNIVRCQSGLRKMAD